MSRTLLRIIYLIWAVALCACPGSGPRFPYEKGVPLIDPIEINVDARFDLEEQQDIEQALVSWKQASSDRVRFKTNWNQTRPGSFQQYSKPNRKSGIFIWALDKKELTDNQYLEWQNYLGMILYSQDPTISYILIFIDTREGQAPRYRTDRSTFFSVILHETGHLIGLKHVQNMRAGMSPAVSVGCISQLDARQLCELYGCEPKPQCWIPEQENMGPDEKIVFKN